MTPKSGHRFSEEIMLKKINRCFDRRHVVVRQSEMMADLVLNECAGVRHTITYCQYGDTRMKPTDIWTNVGWWQPKTACNNGDTCRGAARRENRHTRHRRGGGTQSYSPQVF
jgi:hypothetical protein